MTPSDDEASITALSPDDAFSVLGNETRIQILQILGEAEEPLSFTELFDGVDERDSGNFTYHLNKLSGHFISGSSEGYDLTQAGSRVIEAILSGAVTEVPVLEPTRIEKPCSYCGTPILVSYYEEEVQKHCPSCDGTYGRERVDRGASEPAEYGFLGSLDLPPSGVRGRAPMEVLEAAYSWSLLEHFAWAEGICPRCSASIESSVDVCENHDTSNGSCVRCEQRYAVTVQYWCPNCHADHGGMFVNHLLTVPNLLAFLLAHDVNPLSPPPRRFSASVWVYEEDIVNTDPFEASFTFSINGDDLTLTVDDELEVVAVERDPDIGPD